MFSRVYATLELPRQGEQPCTRELLRNSVFSKIWLLGVDGVLVTRRYQPIAYPFGRHSHTSSKFLPRRPLPRPPRFDSANSRLRHRSTANPSALSRLLWWLRHSSLLCVQLPVLNCFQTILPHVSGDAVTYRLRRLRRFAKPHQVYLSVACFSRGAGATNTRSGSSSPSSRCGVAFRRSPKEQLNSTIHGIGAL